MATALLYDRLQFAVTVTFHYLFPQLTMDLLCEQAAMATASTPLSCHRITLQVALDGEKVTDREGEGA